MQQTHYKVLHIGFGGGIASLIINLIENKTEDFDFDVMAFSIENGEHLVERLKKAGSNVYVMPRPRIDGYNSYRNYVSKVMADNHYDAVHCHITGWRALSFYRLAKTAGIRKFFLHAHSSRYETKFDRSFPVLAISRYSHHDCNDRSWRQFCTEFNTYIFLSVSWCCGLFSCRRDNNCFSAALDSKEGIVSQGDLSIRRTLLICRRNNAYCS